MSYAAFKLVHAPTGVENCVSAFLTHSAGDSMSDTAPLRSLDADEDGTVWAPSAVVGKSNRIGEGQLPNLVLTKGNVLEVYQVRVEEGNATSTSSAPPAAAARRGGILAGIATAWLELVCYYRWDGLSIFHSTIGLLHTVFVYSQGPPCNDANM
eukprot:c34282_g1_i1 orf=219-680(+)